MAGLIYLPTNSPRGFPFLCEDGWPEEGGAVGLDLTIATLPSRLCVGSGKSELCVGRPFIHSESRSGDILVDRRPQKIHFKWLMKREHISSFSWKVQV